MRPNPKVALGSAAALKRFRASPAAGVQAAMTAGMRVLGYAPKGDRQGLCDMGAEVFVSMADVPGLLGL